jgi:hypothetical protein
MNFKKLTDKAKQVVDSRGGVDSLKEDAQQLREIAKGEGSLKDKAKEAVSAVKSPGGDAEVAGSAADPTAEATPIAEADPAPSPSHPGEAPKDPLADDLPGGERDARGADEQV